VLWYEGVYVTFNAAAWQAATALEPAPKLSEVTERLAAKPYTPEKNQKADRGRCQCSLHVFAPSSLIR
jgi:hypothetical protein